MNTREIIEQYLQRVKEKSDWETFIGEEIVFESPSPTTVGKTAYITAASRFFSMAESLDILELIVQGEKATAWVNYHLRLPNQKTFTCLVAELLKVNDGKITASRILFDTSALKAFTTS